MLKPSPRRPSPAFVLAFVALVVALSGTAIAKVVISGRSIKPHTISGRRLENNTLTGKQIAESKLNIVPRAKKSITAHSSGTALTAGNVAGVTARRISLVANPKTGSTGVLSLDGLNVFASCSAAGNAGLTAQSAVSGGDLRVSVVTSSTTTHTGSDASFNTPNTFDLTRTAPFGTGELNFINKTNGQVVSATYTFHNGNTKAPCVFAGVAWGG